MRRGCRQRPVTDVSRQPPTEMATCPGCPKSVGPPPQKRITRVVRYPGKQPLQTAPLVPGLRVPRSNRNWSYRPCSAAICPDSFPRIKLPVSRKFFNRPSALTCCSLSRLLLLGRRRSSCKPSQSQKDSDISLPNSFNLCLPLKKRRQHKKKRTVSRQGGSHKQGSALAAPSCKSAESRLPSGPQSLPVVFKASVSWF